MTTEEYLIKYGNSYSRGLWKRLDDEQRRMAVRAFARHREACEKAGIEIDPRFLGEALDDIRRGLMDA